MNEFREYIDSLVAAPLFESFLRLTPFSKRELIILLLTAPARYKEHNIKKRRGGLRLISQPTAEVKLLQRALVNGVLVGLPIHECATGYIRGKSIYDHAAPHAQGRYLLKMDFENFFPNITEGVLREFVLRSCNFSPVEVDAIINILCKKDLADGSLSLSIGAPSSPFVSNVLLYDFDGIVNKYCADNGVIYTRYADDLAFSTSTPKKLDEVQHFIEFLVEDYSQLGLRINHGKTVNISKKFNRNLVGLVLSNEGRVSIGRDNKRKLRSMVHKFTQGLLSVDEVNYLRGMLSFVNSIDEDFVVGLCERHNIHSISAISVEDNLVNDQPIDEGDEPPF